MTHAIPIVDRYRGVGIHDAQSRDRIDDVVKPAIDVVYRMNDPTGLVGFATNQENPPEARLFAAAKYEAIHSVAAGDRLARPLFELDFVRAIVAGLNSATWRSPTHFG